MQFRFSLVIAVLFSITTMAAPIIVPNETALEARNADPVARDVSLISWASIPVDSEAPALLNMEDGDTLVAIF
ncbi:hypothetical protein B0H16DRAFT_1734717 [Mycena metata]|uniref:Uncharacterized protein n=1 Tax=Mycena metata TaxID=1033252 RepID=A0AAD7HU11_9AGAR|nr:hypothetical protein B0H16DRAFT_1734717 [Mycena metata]